MRIRLALFVVLGLVMSLGASPVFTPAHAQTETQVLANPSFELPGQNGAEPTSWSQFLFDNETGPFRFDTPIMNASGQFPPPTPVPDGDFAVELFWQVGSSLGVMGAGLEQTAATFGVVDETNVGTLRYNIAETFWATPSAVRWSGAVVELEITGDGQTHSLRYFHPGSRSSAIPEDTGNTVYVPGGQLLEDQWAPEFTQDVAGDIATHLGLTDYTIDAVRIGNLQERIATSPFSNQTTYFDRVELTTSTGANAPVRPSCPDLTAASGTSGSVDVSASDADGIVTEAALTSAPDGVELTGVVPATTEGGALTATLTSTSDLTVGSYEAGIEFTNDDTDPQTASCTVTITVEAAPGEPTPISTVQGAGSSTPLAGTEVTIEGVVTSVLVGDEHGNELGGFYVEEEQADRDADAATSEGLFVFAGAQSSSLQPVLESGDLVRVTGQAQEFFTQTQVNASSGTIDVLGDGPDLPAASIMTELPEADPSAHAAAFEPIEGMRVQLAGPWSVAETFNLHTFGEVTLVPGTEPLQNATNVGEPGPEAGEFERDTQDNLTTLTLDDARNGNLANEGLPAPYVEGDAGTIRRGSVTTDLTAIMVYDFGRYRLRPVDDEREVVFDYADRPGVPHVGGELKVATFNVLNYFNGDGQGGGFPTARGARTPAEFERQATKIVAALEAIDADVVGLVEIENDGFGPGSAVVDLVDRLNAVAEPGEEYAVAETPDADGRIGTDAIAVPVIYRPDEVTFDGYDLLEVPPFRINTRVPVAARFTDEDSGEDFVVINNHLKSKGSGSGENADQGDGQAASNADRVLAANELVSWVDTDPFFGPDARVLITGDLNAYANEDPIDVFTDAGYTDLLDRFQAGDREPYTYVFFGAEGRLDYGLANAAIDPFVTGTAAWHVNADEPRGKDYTFFNQPELFEPGPYRSSDHDPVLIGLDLTEEDLVEADLAVTTEFNKPKLKAGQKVQLRVTVTAESVADEVGAVTDIPVDVATALPAGATIDKTYLPEDTTFDPATGRWTIDSLRDGESVTFKVRVTTSRASVGDVELTAEIGAPEGFTDPDPADNTDMTTLPIQPR